MTADEPWRGPLLRLGGGKVLLAGSALLDVVRALETAQYVTSRDGYGPNPRWRWLFTQLRAELADAERTAAAGSAALPQLDDASWSSQDLIDTQEAAVMLGCKPRNVRDLHGRGVLESGRVVGGRLLLERAEVLAEAHRRQEVRQTRKAVA